MCACEWIVICVSMTSRPRGVCNLHSQYVCIIVKFILMYKTNMLHIFVAYNASY